MSKNIKSKKILKVENLGVTLDGKKILENITFSVNPREVLIILGPNGAGKSMLLRTLLGLIPHTGKVEWATKNISYLPPQELINKQYLLPLTVKEFLSLKNITKINIQKLMLDVGLSPELINHQIKKLSTGQFQRMLIAFAISNNPDVLVFDEPTTGIDIGGEETVFTLLHKLWEERNLTIILVTHHMHIVWEHATDVLCINKKLICYGNPEKILTKDNLEKIYGLGARLYEHRHNSQ